MAIQGLEFDKPTLVDGGHEQKAIINTASGKQPTNTPTVEEIQQIAKGIAQKEAETEGSKSYTKTESDTKFLSKTDAQSGYAAKDSVYTKTQSDEKYSAKESGGYKMQVAVIPESLLEAGNREVTEDEKQWMNENYNSLAFKKDYLLLQNVNYEKTTDFVYFTASVVGERDNNGDIMQLYQIHISVNFNSDTVVISIVDIDNT